MIAFLFLMGYLFIGVLDSIHFRLEKIHSPIGTSNVVSVLDLLLSPLVLQTERTYSAPFAIYSYMKEAITSEEGTMVRAYPRLEHAGQYLDDPHLHRADVQKKMQGVFLKSILLWMAFAILNILLGTYRHKLSWEEFLAAILKGNTLFPWRSYLVTVAVFIFFIVLIHDFMHYYHILGTDQVGKDVLYKAIKSIRTGLLIGILTTICMLPFALFFGTVAGYFRGWLDDVIQYLYTTLSSIPGVLLIAAAILAMQILMERHNILFDSVLKRQDARILVLCGILGITTWTTLCRYIRAEAIKIKSMDYVQSAYCLGVSHCKIIFRHLLPNMLHIILITIVLDFSGLVLAEAVLSYVGVGVDPSSYSWGTMINSARLEMARVPMIWWNLFSAFLFMFVLVLSANIFSDAVREVFDPYTAHGERV